MSNNPHKGFARWYYRFVSKNNTQKERGVFNMTNTIAQIKGIDFTTYEGSWYLLEEIKDTVTFFDMDLSYIELNMLVFATIDSEFKLVIFENNSTVETYEVYHGQERIEKCERILL